MPQFEVVREGAYSDVQRVRARTAEAAVQAVLDDPIASLSLKPPDDYGWRDAELAGAVVARVREHATRMRFRRE
ncbi:hypothetical protein BH23ACT11_BH23ACT11_17630 [soil metagenome]